jgi:type IV fimbrial biogenesis protein FimT
MRTAARLRGVSLIEASIVMAIAAITLATAAPGFQGFIEKQRLHGAAAQLASDLHFARAEAVMRNTPLRFTLHQAAWGSCYVIHTGAAQDCRCETAASAATCTGEAEALKTVQWTSDQGISLQSAVRSLLFDPLHGTSTPAGTLKVVAASGRAVHHVVNVMGRVRTCSPQGAATVAGYRSC